MDLAIFVEGQYGLNWERWKRLTRAIEDLGYAAIYRSDHFTLRQPPDRDSLELWVSLTWLADNTSRVEFGPLVSPVSFRDPVFTARMAKDVDDLSGGRLRLGLGAGWQEREHTLFGYDLPDLKPRFDRFEEGLEVITRLLRDDNPVDFEGKYYRLRGAQLLPRPARPGGPPIVIGGTGKRRTLSLIARYADEWNASRIPAAELKDLNRYLDCLLEAEGRAPKDVFRSIMVNLILGENQAEVERALQAREMTLETARYKGLLGSMQEMVDQLGAYAEAGAQRVILQWIDLDDLDTLEAIAARVLPQL